MTSRSRRSSSSAAGSPASGCAKELAKHDVHVTLLDRNNYHQFQPLLYQVATAELAHDRRRPPAAGDLRQGRRPSTSSSSRSPTSTRHADGHDDRRRRRSRATTSCSPPGRGRTSSARRAPTSTPFPLYSVDDAKALRTRIFEVFEEADANPARIDQGALNFVIVGAGPTGVETAGAVADLVNEVMPDALPRPRRRSAPASTSSTTARSCSPPSPTRPTPTRPRSSSTTGVILRLGTGVNEVSADQRHAQRRHRDPDPHRRVGRRHPGARAGRQGRAGAGTRRPTDRRARPDGRGPSHTSTPSATWPTSPTTTATTFPQLGSVALQAGRWAAENILADIAGKPRQPVPLQGQGHHGDDRRRRGRRRDGPPPPRAARPHGVRRLARRARLADERRPPAGRRLHRRGRGTSSARAGRARSSTIPTPPRSTGATRTTTSTTDLAATARDDRQSSPRSETR